MAWRADEEARVPCYEEVMSRRWDGVRGRAQRGGKVGAHPVGIPGPEDPTSSHVKQHPCSPRRWGVQEMTAFHKASCPCRSEASHGREEPLDDLEQFIQNYTAH